jgi:hypothetical protein
VTCWKLLFTGQCTGRYAGGGELLLAALNMGAMMMVSGWGVNIRFWANSRRWEAG